MMKLLITFSWLLVVASFMTVSGQKLVNNSAITGICYAGSKTNRIYIPPPDAFLKKSDSKSGGSLTIYYTGFSPEGKIAMEYAADILETMLPPDTKMTIVASWEKISTEGVLGNSSITGYAGGWWLDALDPLAYYPVSLAEKIAGESLNDDQQGDFVITINSSIDWYLGTDGQTPVQKYDLVTVVLHEICHGLGFFDSMRKTRTTAYFGFPALVMINDSVSMINDTLPMIYDTFLESLDEKKLTDSVSFNNNSPELLRQITGGQLYFDGILLNNYTAGSRARLYAPAVFSAGSSVSHLDEENTPEPNTLMTPFIDKGEAIHNPGDFTFSVLGDLGWINTKIIHEPLDDTEDFTVTDINLIVNVKSDTTYDRDRVGVVFSFNDFQTSDTLYMSSVNSDDNFNVIVDLPAYNTELKYFFFVEDCFSRIYRSPSLYEKLKYSVYVGADTVKPVISHTPVTYYLESPDSLGFTATVKDNKGVDTVYVEYIVNTGIPKIIGLTEDSNDIYKTIFNVKPELLKGGDSIRYRIYAIDSALTPNTSVLPETGYFVIDIEDISTTLESYATDFSGGSADFFNIGFEVKKPAGFSKFGLHTRHPYESPGENGNSIEYTAMLRHPLKFNESGMMFNFNEIVLVEPGEPGTVFGSPDFYDYVILDGSKDFGKTWFNLIDGYDSRYVKSWETSYNSEVVDGNSTFTATESMLIKHTFLYRQSDKISAGDTLLLRFRLYSDPLANGWGWVISDLKINPLIDAVENIDIAQVKIYPNPGNGHINISGYSDGLLNHKQLRYSIFSSEGVNVKSSSIKAESEIVADISSCPTGIYIIVLYLDDGIRTYKYSLIK